MEGELGLAVGGRPQFSTRGSLQGSLSVLPGEWLPPASREGNPKEQGKSCKNLVLEVTHLHLCCILLVTQASHDSLRKGTTLGYDWRGISLGAILIAGYHIGQAEYNRCGALGL